MILNMCPSVKKVRLKTKNNKVYLDKNTEPKHYTFDSTIYKFDSTILTFDRV